MKDASGRVFSNCYFIRTDDLFTRIDFFDLVDGVKTPTGGMIMINQDARGMAELILQLHAQHEAKKAQKQ